MNGTPLTQRQAVGRNYQQYEQLIQDGSFVPSRFPFTALPIIFLFAFLLLPQRYSGLASRIIATFAVSSSALYLVFFTRSKDPSTGTLLGMLNGYLILWSIAHLLDVDLKRDYARIVRYDGPTKQVNGLVAQETPQKQDGSTRQLRSGDRKTKSAETDGIAGTTREKSVAYKWQGFPSDLSERLDWSIDLVTNMDGMGWSWAVASRPVPPARVQNSLSHDKDGARFNRDLIEKRWLKRTKEPEDLTPATLLRKTIRQLILGYVTVDILKTMISVDPWFYGKFDASPPPYLPKDLHYSVLIKLVRLVVGIGCLQYVIYIALTMRTLIYVVLQRRKDIGVRGEPWMYPDIFGSLKSVAQYGLAGFWSHYWHQVFRYVFSAPSQLLIRHLNLPRRGNIALFIRFSTVFLCSGLLHASMSYALIGPSDPIVPLLFFLSQGLGIAVQFVAQSMISKTALAKRLPSWVYPVSNVIWALIVLYFSGYMLAKDLARANAFVFEPVPFSPLRGLFGCKEDGYYCWRGRWFQWQWAGWRSGLEA